jgi:hypothetical protein
VQTNKIFFNVVKARKGDMTHLAVQEVVSASVSVGDVKAILMLPLLVMFRSFQFPSLPASSATEHRSRAPPLTLALTLRDNFLEPLGIPR